jgi:predicted DNA-binding transcriptional regulator YafY
MSHPATRVLAVLDLLQTHDRLRGEDIATLLEVDVRTIRRYIEILREVGLPIEQERGRYGGYRLRPGFRMPLRLTDLEALTIAVGVLGSPRHSESSRHEHSPEYEKKQALAKLTRALPASAGALLRHIEEIVTFATPARAEEELCAVEHLRTALQAARSSHRLRLRYRDGNGQRTERLVDPGGIVHRHGRWYLVAYCHLRAGQRVFRLDHIEGATLLSDTFIAPRIDALAAVEEAIGQAPWRWEYCVQLKMPLAEARRRIPPSIAALSEDDGRLLMRGFADDLAWLAHLLSGLGAPLVVLHPPELRYQLRLLAEHTQRIATEPEPQV